MSPNTPIMIEWPAKIRDILNIIIHCSEEVALWYCDEQFKLKSLIQCPAYMLPSSYKDLKVKYIIKSPDLNDSDAIGLFVILPEGGIDVLNPVDQVEELKEMNPGSENWCNTEILDKE